MEISTPKSQMAVENLFIPPDVMDLVDTCLVDSPQPLRYHLVSRRELPGPRKNGIMKLLTVKQAADRLACKPDVIYRLVRAGRLSVINISSGVGRRIRIEESAIAAFIESRRIGAIPEPELPVPKTASKLKYAHLLTPSSSPP